MGGEVGVRSEVDVGSTFWLRLPLARGEFQSADAQSAGADSGWDGALNGRTILVVDDNTLNQRVASELLQVTGAKVLLAGDGLMALQQLAWCKVDAVLMDVQMPVMDGLEATRRIRAEPSLAGLCVIAMTANARGEDAAACRAAGMDDFLTKPVIPENLYATLVKWLGSDAAAARAAPAHTPTFAPAPAPAHVAAVAPSDAATAGEVVDLAVLVQLTSGNKKMMMKIAASFITSMARTVAELEAALATGDRAALAALGHKAKSSAGTVGAHGLCRLCLELETSMGEEAADIDDARPIVAAIRALKDPIAEQLSALGA
jgi:CheY-like chemotaxis protein/HPt (histidine-containing phosphotransfer) domain-containing protein